jgi:hypothetical protein
MALLSTAPLLVLAVLATGGCTVLIRSDDAEFGESSAPEKSGVTNVAACGFLGAPRYLKAPRPIRSAFFGGVLAVHEGTLIATSVAETDSASPMSGQPETPCHPRSTLPADTTGAGVVRVYDGELSKWADPVHEIRHGAESQALLPATTLGGSAALGIYTTHPVALSARYLAIGDASAEAFRGAVRVFDRNDRSFIERSAALREPDGALNNVFGMALALYENILVVGAPGDDVGADNSGAAYVYDLAAANPLRPSRLKAARASDSAWFGAAVAASAEWIFVGAAGDDRSAAAPSDDGAVYAFRRDGSVVDTTPQKLEDPPALGFFGVSLAHDGNLLAVGAPGAHGPTGAAFAGAVYLYGLEGSEWSLARTIDGNGELGTLFGANVALSRDLLVVGMPFGQGHSEAPTDEGSMHVFARTGTEVSSERCRLQAPNVDACDAFGTVLVATNDFIAAAAPFEDGAEVSDDPDTENGLLDSGAVYVYPVVR